MSSDALIHARRLHGLGVAQNDAGRPANAARLLRRALRTIEAVDTAGSDRREQHRLIARIWISIATSESELSGLGTGVAALTVAEEHVRLADEPLLEFLCQSQLGYMKVRGGQVQDGLRHLDAAERLLSHAEPLDQYRLLLNRGTTHMFRGDHRRARGDLAAAAAVAYDNGWSVEEAKARHNLGYLEFLSGNLATALQIMDQVGAVETDVSLAVVLLDRSRVLLEAGLHREADDSLRDAHGLFRAARLWKDVGEVDLARAECALLGGETVAARRLAADARNRFRGRANDRWRREAELVVLQADLAAGRRGTRLAGSALELAEEFRAEGLPSRARTARLIAAEALLRSGRLDAARDVAGAAGPVRRNDPVSARLQTRLVRAELQAAAGERRRAKREIRTGLAELAQHQARFGSLDLQTASAIHGRQLAELDLELALSERDAIATLAAIERGRALASRLPAVEAPADEFSAALLAELRQLAEDMRVIESDPAAVEVVATRRRRMSQIEQMLRSRSWHAEGPGEAGKPAGFAAIADELAERAAVLICFVQARDILYALAVAGAHARIVPLGPAAPALEAVRRVRAALDVLGGGRLPTALSKAVRGSLDHGLAGLDQLMLAPLDLGNARLVLAPTGILGVLPWNLLPSLRARPVVVTPSATAWLAAAIPGGRPASLAVSCFAGPGLTHADNEARDVGRIWASSAVYLGERARQQELRSALTSSTVVHIAAHGQHQAENPLFSSIRLADGPTYAYELDRTARAAEHVVLSACELGLATIRPGDEALGLTSVLLRLGTRSVVSGVARIHDEVAGQVMVRYHRLLASGTDAAEAIAAATEHLAEFPAPFVCFGSAWSIA